MRRKRRRSDYFKRTRGLTPEQVETVDHNHETGELHALLCFKCNSALGNFDDDPERMRRAARYVEGEAWPPIKFDLGQFLLPS